MTGGPAASMHATVAWGKIVSFLVLTIFVSLLQLWLLVIILARDPDKVLSLSQLLGGGVLFFFATSLAASSFATLIDKHPLSFGSGDFNWSLIAGAFPTVAAIALYVHVLTQGYGTPFPFKADAGPQIGCASSVFAYALYVAVRTGRFLR